MKNVAVIVVAGLLVGACGSKMDPNAKNFGAALSKDFEKNGALCLGQTKWPVELNEGDLRSAKSWPSAPAAQMLALEEAGLVTGADGEVEGKDLFGKPNGSRFKVRRYTISDAGKPFVQQKDVTVFSLGGSSTVKKDDLCYGKVALDKVVKWEGPLKLGDYQEARVIYSYKVANVAAWTSNADIQKSFPIIKTMLDNAGKGESRRAVKLTSEGWETL